MNCDIYKAINHKGAYLFVEAGKTVDEVVPDEVLNKLKNLNFFKSIVFDENSPLIAVNPAEVINNISSQGYHVQGVEIKVNEVSEAGAALGAGILAASIGFGPVGAIVGAAVGYLLANASKEENENES